MAQLSGQVTYTLLARFKVTAYVKPGRESNPMTTISSVYPGTEWGMTSPGEVGVNAGKLEDAKQRLSRAAERYGSDRYRVVVVREVG